MNRIYLVVWNASLGIWSAVSELGKGRKKSNSLAKVLALATTMLVGSYAFATETTRESDPDSSDLIDIIEVSSNSDITNKIYNDETSLRSTQTDNIEKLPLGQSSYEAGTNASASGVSSTAIGYAAIASADYSTAIGTNASASSNSSTVIGYNASALGVASTAIGRSAIASAVNASALGANAKAIGIGSTAVGSGSTASNYATAIGAGAAASGVSSTAFGNGAVASSTQSVALGTNAEASGTQSMALGNSATATDYATALGTNAAASGVSSTALGNNSYAQLADSVALGSNSVVSADKPAVNITSATVGSLNFDGFSGTVAAEGHQVSIGGTIKDSSTGKMVTIYRQLKNMAAGEISSTSTDAINGSQLYSTNIILSDLATSTTNLIGGNAVNNNGVITATNIGNTGKDTIHDAIASINQTANAAKTEVEAGNNMVVTSSKNPDGSTNYQVSTAKDVTFDSVTTDKLQVGQVTIDENGINAGEQKITGIADGEIAKGSQDAVNGSQINEMQENLANIIGGNAVNNNGEITATNIGNTGKDTIHDAIASINQTANAAKTDIEAGNNMVVTSSKNPDGSTNYQVSTAKDVTFDSVTTDKLQVGQVTIDENGINAGGQVVANVSDGAINSASKEAINGSQLFDSNSIIYDYLGGGANYETGTGPTYHVNGETHNNVGDALGALDQRDNELQQNINDLGNQLEQSFTSINNRIDTVEKRANAGIAAAMALESAPFIAGKWTYAAATAYHGGENAVGVTLRNTSESGRWSMTAGLAAASEGKPSFRIGISGLIN